MTDYWRNIDKNILFKRSPASEDVDENEKKFQEKNNPRKLNRMFLSIFLQ